jgi:hypothetical protein
MKMPIVRRNKQPIIPGTGPGHRALQWFAALGLPLVASAGWPEDYERGRHLYENHCQACHSSLLHSPVSGRIKSFRELQSQVSSWSSHAAKAWSAEEVNDVSYYLDRTFYHFGVSNE